MNFPQGALQVRGRRHQPQPEQQGQLLLTDNKNTALYCSSRYHTNMPSVLSKPLYFWSKYTDLQNEIHTDKQCVMNCHGGLSTGRSLLTQLRKLRSMQKFQSSQSLASVCIFRLTKTIQKYDGTSCGGRQKGMKNIWMN